MYLVLNRLYSVSSGVIICLFLRWGRLFVDCIYSRLLNFISIGCGVGEVVVFVWVEVRVSRVVRVSCCIGGI